VVKLSPADPIPGHLESYSAVRVRRDRLAQERVGHLAAATMRKLDDALALLFDHEA
jgi:mRNA-degrading endonuclease toxin of MazEF toxin-antitoxin module